jgi:hypothetical protein
MCLKKPQPPPRAGPHNAGHARTASHLLLARPAPPPLAQRRRRGRRDAGRGAGVCRACHQRIGAGRVLAGRARRQRPARPGAARHAGHAARSLYAQIATHPEVARASPVLELPRPWPALPASHQPPRGTRARPTRVRGLGADALLLPAMAPALMPRPWEPRRVMPVCPRHRVSQRGGLAGAGPAARWHSPAPRCNCRPACAPWPCAWQAPWRPRRAAGRDGHWRRARPVGARGQLTRIDLQLQPGTDRSAFSAGAASPARLARQRHAGRAGRCRAAHRATCRAPTAST